MLSSGVGDNPRTNGDAIYFCFGWFLSFFFDRICNVRMPDVPPGCLSPSAPLIGTNGHSTRNPIPEVVPVLPFAIILTGRPLCSTFTGPALSVKALV